MKKIIYISLFVITSGCSVFQPDETTIVQPRLLKQAELPPFQEPITSNKIEFYCEMHINVHGEVDRAKIISGSGNAKWDSLAELSFMEWKYSPAIYMGNPIPILVRRKIIVVFAEPKIIQLAEILLESKNLADSVYNQLILGADFTSMVLKHSISASKNKNGIIGNTNIGYFSAEIKSALNDLHEGEFTKPLNYGEHYIIFKRLILNN